MEPSYVVVSVCVGWADGLLWPATGLPVGRIGPIRGDEMFELWDCPQVSTGLR